MLLLVWQIKQQTKKPCIILPLLGAGGGDPCHLKTD
jgi:hypothetical protein